MQVYKESRRPSERAEQFLQEYISQSHHLPGDRLPSPRQIAVELNVSESTVRGVVRKWLQEGKLRSRQGSGIYICKSPERSARRLRIGANVSNQMRNLVPSWGDTIHFHALEAVMELGPKGSFTSLYSAEEVINDIPDAEILNRCRDLDGVILYQVSPHVPAIQDYFRSQGKPFVYLNPPSDDAVSNFVALETFTAFYRTAHALRCCGRRRFVLLIHPALDRSVSTRQRLSGVANGIGEELGLSVELRIVVCPGFQEKDGEEQISRLISKDGFRPDAILCAGDGLALGACQALQAHGLSVPRDVSIIAGAGFSPEIREQGISTLVQPLDGVARNLVAMLLEMIERQVRELPARLLPIGLHADQTTTREENNALKTLFADNAKHL